MADLILVRHEISIGNITKKYADKTVSLAPIGKIRCKNVRKELTKYNIEDYIILSSEYKRARETALYSLKRKDYLRLRENSLLNEVDCGDLVGRNFKENYEIFGEKLDPWLKNPLKKSPPGGESYLNGIKRAKQFIESIISKDQKVLAFTHEGFIQCVYAYLTGEWGGRRVENGEIIHFYL